MPPRPDTDSEAAAVPWATASARVSPRTSRAVAVPVKQSPAPVASTGAGFTGTGW